MNRPRKKAEYLLFAGLLALFIATGCAHGNGEIRRIDSAAVESPELPLEKDQGGGVDKPLDAMDAGTPSGELASSTNVDPVPDEKTVGDAEEKGNEPPPDSEKTPPSESFVGGDNVDDFFDDTESLPEDAPVTQVEELVPDPLITFNRAMFAVNDKLYFWCLKPVAQGYKKVAPAIVRKGVRNFFHNLGTPARFVSSMLQGKFRGAGSELGRFLVNSTVGIGGVWDPAEMYLGLKPSDEDLGQTLGSYHVDNGVFIVWPLLGPSTLRDTVGKVGDLFLNPLYYLNPNELAWGLSGLDTVNDTSYRIGDYETVKSTYMDPYVMIRDFYITHRKKKIAE